MTEQEKKICEKIAKLFAMANDTRTSDGERATAMKLASEMMSKYNLSHDSIKQRDLLEDWAYINDEKGQTYTSIPSWLHSLYGGVYRYFGIFSVAGRDEEGDAILKFAGRELDITLADYCFDIIYHQILVLAEEYRVQEGCRRNSSEHNSYLSGLVYGALQSLKAIVSDVKSETEVKGTSMVALDQALVRHDEAQKYWMSLHPEARISSRGGRVDGAAASRGVAAASGISVRAGVSRTSGSTISIGMRG